MQVQLLKLAIGYEKYMSIYEIPDKEDNAENAREKLPDPRKEPGGDGIT